MRLVPVTIVIARTVPSLNASMWRHRSVYTKERDFWKALIRVQLVPRREPPDHPVRCTILSLRMRLLDYDDLVGGAKAIPDALKRLGYIHDDSPQWFKCDYRQEKAPKALRCTTISLEPA